MALEKRCKSCGHKKPFGQFSKPEGETKKLNADCDQCLTAKAAGLNPLPSFNQKPDEDLEMARRKRLYKLSVERRKQGLEA